jgi:uncharacterized membrane protein
MPQIIVTFTASQMRGMARDSLGGNWFKVMIGFCIISLMQNIPVFILQEILITGDVSLLYDPLSRDLMTYLTPSLIIYAYILIISGPVTLGMYMFILNYLRTRTLNYELLLSGFANLGKSVLLMILLITILTFSIFLIVPAIIFGVAFSMCYFILADNLQMKSTEVIAHSWRITNRNKYKLFCVQISFIGWGILAGLIILGFSVLIGLLSIILPVINGFWQNFFSFIIEMLVLIPVQVYYSTTSAIFYEILSGKIPPGPGYISLGPGQF